MTEMTLERRAAMATLLADRPKNLFVVPGLGSTTWDAAAAAGGNDDRDFYLWGAMGGAAMIGLGLALAQPKLRVAVITGDGEMLMGLGSLATIGVKQPPNLFLVVSTTGSTARPACRRATPRTASTFCNVARACGFERVLDIYDQDGLDGARRDVRTSNRMLFARVRISREDAPRFLPEKDGVVIKDRVRKAVALLASDARGRGDDAHDRADVRDDANASLRAASAVLAEHQ